MQSITNLCLISPTNCTESLSCKKEPCPSVEVPSFFLDMESVEVPTHASNSSHVIQPEKIAKEKDEQK